MGNIFSNFFVIPHKFFYDVELTAKEKRFYMRIQHGSLKHDQQGEKKIWECYQLIPLFR